MKYIDCWNSTFFEKFETKVKIISDDIKVKINSGRISRRYYFHNSFI